MSAGFHVVVLNYVDGFLEGAEAIHHGLLEAGYDSILTTGMKQFKEFPKRRRIIFASKLGKLIRQAFPGTDWREVIDDSDIIFNTEQLRENLLIAHELDEILTERTVWDYSTCNMDFLRSRACRNAILVPLGTVEHLRRIPRAKYDADVMFYGTTNERRRVILDELRRSGLVCRFFDQHLRIWGKERDELIGRTKIIVNIHFYSLKIFEVFRTFYPLVNGKCLISEDGVDGNQRFYQDGTLFCSYDRIVENVIRVANDNSLLEQQEQRAVSSIRQLRQADILKDALALS
jgi:hypothetical protein